MLKNRWRKHKETRIKELKSNIKRLGFIPFFKKSSKLYKKILPYSYYEDLKKICKLYNTKLKIQIVNQTHIEKKGQAVFQHYWRTSESESYFITKSEILMFCVSGNIITSYDIVYVFTHELAHAIQLHYYGSDWPKHLEYELEADRLAYFIAKEYCQKLDQNISHNKFSSYKTEHNKKWLQNYHKYK